MRYLLLSFLLSINAYASLDWNPIESIKFESALFEEDHNDQTTDYQLATTIDLEKEMTWKSGWRFVVDALARVSEQSERNYLFAKNIYLEKELLLSHDQSLKFLIGSKTYQWSQMEFFHPLNVVNSKNYDSNFEKFEDVGEPVLEVSYMESAYQLQLLFLPYLQENHFSSPKTRMGIGLGDYETYWMDESAKDKNWEFQGGMRYFSSLEHGDIHLHLLHYYDRSRFLVGTDQFSLVLGNPIPLTSLQRVYYFKTTEYGAGFTYIFNSTILKLEGTYKTFSHPTNILTPIGVLNNDDHGIVSVGVEQGGLSLWGSDLTLYAEYQRVVGMDQTERELHYILQNDLFAGVRIAFNDLMGSELKLFWVSDTERDQENFYGVTFLRRFTDHWKWSAGVKIFDAPKKSTFPQGLESFDKSDLIFYNLNYFF